MEDKLDEVFSEVSPSVVIVSNRSDHCTGFVVVATKECTFIMTDSTIAESDNDKLVIHFSDMTQAEASVEVRGSGFCLVKAGYHPSCKSVRFMECEAPPLASQVLTIAPALNSEFYSLPGYVSLEKGEAYGLNFDDFVEGSDTEIVATCDYSELRGNGKSRVICAPVFNEDKRVIGIIVGDYGDVDFDGRKSGFDMKRVLLAKHVDKLLTALVENVNWLHCKKNKRKDWKSHLLSLSSKPETGKRKR